MGSRCYACGRDYRVGVNIRDGGVYEDEEGVAFAGAGEFVRRGTDRETSDVERDNSATFAR